jgi:hypothetical protein
VADLTDELESVTGKPMDGNKCKLLKSELAEQSDPPVVSITQFFDGNDDPGSIGCNLPDHPGMDVFREVLTGLLQRPDVEGVYAQIAEVDPGDDSWPFADTVLVVGKIVPDALQAALASLEPDDVWLGDESHVPLSVRLMHNAPTLVAWWD